VIESLLLLDTKYNITYITNMGKVYMFYILVY